MNKKKEEKVIEEPNTISLDVFRNSGKKGGSTTKARKGIKFYKKIGKDGAKTRWDKKDDTTPEAV